MTDTSPTLRKRRLGRTLRAMREKAEVTREQVAEELDCSPWKVGRIETGHSGCRRGDLLIMLDMYGVTDQHQRADLVQQAREARGRRKTTYIDLPDSYLTLMDLEPAAQSIRWYEPTLVPGLLQTEDYARAVISAWRPGNQPEEIEKRVKARMDRQTILTADVSPEVWTIIDEAAIRRLVGGPDVMRDQWRHLLHVADQGLAQIQVLPFDAGAHEASTGMFQLMRFADPDDPDAVYMESLAGDVFLERPESVAHVSLVFDHLCAQALSPEKSAELIRAAGGSLA